MSTWLVILLSIVVVLVVVALGYVAFRYFPKKKAISKAALGIASSVLGGIASVIKDKPDKTDAHDIMKALSELTRVGSMALDKHDKGVPFPDIKAELKGHVRRIIDEFPEMKDKVSDELISQEVEAAFALIASIPKVNSIIKK